MKKIVKHTVLQTVSRNQCCNTFHLREIQSGLLQSKSRFLFITLTAFFKNSSTDVILICGKYKVWIKVMEVAVIRIQTMINSISYFEMYFTLHSMSRHTKQCKSEKDSFGLESDALHFWTNKQLRHWYAFKKLFVLVYILPFQNICPIYFGSTFLYKIIY